MNQSIVMGKLVVALVSLLSVSAVDAQDSIKPVEPSLVESFYNPTTGELFVYSEEEKNVLSRVGVVSKKMLGDKLSKAAAQQDTKSGTQRCVYTQQTVCSSWVNSPSSYSGKICTGTTVVTTVTCN